LNSKVLLGSLPQTLNGTHVLGLSLLFQGRVYSTLRSSLPHNSLTSITRACSVYAVVYKVSFLPSPELAVYHIGLTCRKRASSSRFARIVLSLSLIFPSFITFSLYSRLPEQVPAPSEMPTSSDAHARALQTATGIPAPEQPHPAAASSARSESPRPRVLRERGGRFSSHPRGQDGVRVKTRPWSPPLDAPQCHE
jgi:hypothetical protein